MVSVLISADSRYPVSRPKIKKRVEQVLESRKITSDSEVSILVCGTRKALELAKKFLDDDSPHNVLSFPLAEEDGATVSPTAQSAKGFVEFHKGQIILGDIAVCYPLAQEEASRDNMMVDDKMMELVEHGLLHLLGEHHT